VDVVERLTLEAASKPTSQACEHIHRYEFAADLCGDRRVLDLACGSGYGCEILAASASRVHGVDNDVATIDMAAATVGQRTSATFEAADAITYLDRDIDAEYDTIVCFEGLEHLHDLPKAVSRLRRHADKDVALILSVPNSRTFKEDNPFHVTDFDHERALALLDELSGGTVLFQYLLEGSLIRNGGSEKPASRLINQDRAERRYANHFLLLVNGDEKRLAAAVRGLRGFVEAPVHNRYMRSLEVANRQLGRRNSELARKMMREGAITIARAGSAVPAYVNALERRIAEFESQTERMEAEIGDRDDQIAQRDGEIAHRDREIAHREDMILAQRRELLELRQELVRRSTVAPSVGERLRRRLGRERAS
jgi:2-polyprenyl-3-methyl-5-hydroxy-6-metoxy-1,4-benzoquinol methylase